MDICLQYSPFLCLILCLNSSSLSCCVCVCSSHTYFYFFSQPDFRALLSLSLSSLPICCFFSVFSTFRFISFSLFTSFLIIFHTFSMLIGFFLLIFFFSFSYFILFPLAFRFFYRLLRQHVFLLAMACTIDYISIFEIRHVDVFLFLKNTILHFRSFVMWFFDSKKIAFTENVFRKSMSVE